MRRCLWAVLCSLFLALATSAVAKDPAGWYSIIYDDTRQADGYWCRPNTAMEGPRPMMDNLDMQRRPYDMKDVEEQGQVMETTLTFVSGGPTPRVEHWTWYRGKERCEKALQARRADAQREQQRREKYR
jgi:hypothetical protein